MKKRTPLLISVPSEFVRSHFYYSDCWSKIVAF